MTDKELVLASIEAQARAYAPYSNFRVGAALLCEDGVTVFTGCNVENTSYGATVCAERTAVVKAVSQGCSKFAAIAVTSSGGGLTYPCGICLQTLAEFAPEIRVILCEKGGEPLSFALKDLFPFVLRL
jgi:cytidine deaminase